MQRGPEVRLRPRASGDDLEPGAKPECARRFHGKFIEVQVFDPATDQGVRFLAPSLHDVADDRELDVGLNSDPHGP